MKKFRKLFVSFLLIISLGFTFSLSSGIVSSELPTSFSFNVTGNIVYSNLLFSTTYTGITKIDDTHASISLTHLMYHPSNTEWDIDGTFGNNFISGAPSLHMWDLSGSSARFEFNVANMQTQLGNEIYVSVWYYFPSDWVVPEDAGWYSLCDPLEGYTNWKPMIELWIHQGSGGRVPPYSSNTNDFVVTLGGQDSNGQQFLMMTSDGTWAEHTFTQSEFPRGRWFNVRWWLRRNPTAGESFINLWFDGVKICDQIAFPYESGELNKWQRNTSGLNAEWTFLGDPLYTDPVDFGYSTSNGYYTTFAKIYHGSSTYVHNLWMDDLEIWNHPPTGV